MIPKDPGKTIGRVDLAYRTGGGRVRASADNLQAVNTPANDTHADAIDELTAMHGRLIAEAATVAKLIGTLQEAGAATTRELARYQLGSQLGGTKLALRLGCGRSYALRLMEGELAPHVRTRADGSRWVPASAVDDWLAAREQVAA